MPNRTRFTGNLVSDNNIFSDIVNDRVGIGTTVPSAKLDVFGDVKVSGVVTATSFVGSGLSITDVRIGIQSGGTNIGFAGTINFVGSGISTVTASSGISTVTIPGILKTRNYYIANEGQTTFSCSYNVGDVEVYMNGSKLSSVSYVANDGTTIVLNDAASLNDEIEIIGYISQTYFNSPKFLTIGVRSNNPLSFSVATNQFNVLNRSGGNTIIYIIS